MSRTPRIGWNTGKAELLQRLVRDGLEAVLRKLIQELGVRRTRSHLGLDQTTKAPAGEGGWITMAELEFRAKLEHDTRVERFYIYRAEERPPQTRIGDWPAPRDMVQVE